MPQDKRYVVEGYWDCQYCENKGIRGRFKTCPHCGHPRDASVTFYTKEIGHDQAITDEEFARERAEADKNSRSSSAKAGEESIRASDEPSLYSRGAGEGRGTAEDAHDASDWLCDYCGSYNKAADLICAFCGAEREMSEGKTYSDARGQVARTYDAQGNLVSERDLSAKPKPAPEPTQPPKRGMGCLVIAAIIAVVAAVGMFFALRPKTVDMKVASFGWERSIAIEQLQTVEESGWSLPAEGRLITTNQEISGYNKVFDHNETVEYTEPVRVLDHYDEYTTTVDNGDGTFDVEEHREPVYVTEYETRYREEPVYVNVPIFSTKYYYEIERWVHERDVTTSGDDHSPQWGEVTLSQATGEHGTGAEREGQRTTTCYVYADDGTSYTADEEFWNSLELGQQLKVKVDGNGHITPKK